MKSVKFKRVGAYFIDLFIVTLLISLISEIKFLNPQQEKLKKAIDTYNEKYGEYLSAVENIDENTTIADIENTINSKEIITYYYDVVKYNISYIIIFSLVIILYYSIFPYFFDGQTIGKKLLKISNCSVNGDKIPLYKYIIKSIVLPIYSGIIFNTVILQLLLFLLTITFKKAFFADIYLAIVLLEMTWGYIDVMFYLIRKDNRSLHDIILKMKVDFTN